MITCDYVLYQPAVSLSNGDIGTEFVYYRDALNRPTLLRDVDGVSSCNCSVIFWLGSDALYSDALYQVDD